MSSDGVKAVALLVTDREEGPGLKLVYSEVVRLDIGRIGDGTPTPQSDEKVTQTVQQLYTQLREQHKVPPDQIYLIGASSIAAELRDNLEKAINKITGKKIIFLDPETEVQLSIVGTIPQWERDGDTMTDNRNTSLLIEIGRSSTKGGYQLLRYSPSAQYDFVAMNIPKGGISVAHEVSQKMSETTLLLDYSKRMRAVGVSPFRASLRRERDSKPGLVNRKRIYLIGDFAWAIATLLHPERRQTLVPLDPGDLAYFPIKAAGIPDSVLFPNLSFISHRAVRREVESELEAIRTTFTIRQLIAGAEMLSAIAGELRWKNKSVWFARHGHLSCILSYVRLQAEK